MQILGDLCFGLCLGLTEVLRHNLVFADSHQEVTAVVPILPLQDMAIGNALFRCGVGDGQGPLLAAGAHCRSGELYAEGSNTGACVVGFLAIPD